MSDLIERLQYPIYRTAGLDDAEPDFEKMQAERFEAAAEIGKLRAVLKLFADVVDLYDRSDAKRRQHEIDELGPNYRKPYVTPDIHQVSVNLGWLRKARSILQPARCDHSGDSNPMTPTESHISLKESHRNQEDLMTDRTIIGWDPGTDYTTIETEWRRRPDGSWEMVGWKAVNHSAEPVTVEPPAALSIAEPRP